MRADHPRPINTKYDLSDQLIIEPFILICAVKINITPIDHIFMISLINIQHLPFSSPSNTHAARTIMAIQPLYKKYFIVSMAQKLPNVGFQMNISLSAPAFRVMEG